MMTDPVVLVTGASGFLGTHVVKLLQEEGFKVKGTVRSTKNEAKVKHLRELCPGAKHPLELVEADLVNEEGWDKAVEGCTYVHHVASPFILENFKDESVMLKPAVEGTLMVLRACAKSGTVKRVVLTSSCVAVNTYGGNTEPKTEKDWEDAERKDLPLYNKSKVLAERAAWDFVDKLPDSEKFELAVVNPSVILGPALHGTPGASIDIMRRLMNREMPMVPSLCLNLVDVRDVALCHLRCQTLPEAAGHRHIASSHNLWFREFAQILDKEFKQYGYKIPTGQLPGPIFSMATWFDKTLKIAKDTSSQPILFDTSRMTQVLGIQPIPAEKSLVDMGYSLIDGGFVKRTKNYKPREQQ